MPCWEIRLWGPQATETRREGVHPSGRPAVVGLVSLCTRGSGFLLEHMLPGPGVRPGPVLVPSAMDAL